MRILGIDPGVATIGFGVVNAEGTRLRMESYGTFTTPAGLPLRRACCRSRRIWSSSCGT